MKTLGCAVILLFSYILPSHAQQVSGGCAAPPSTFRHVWYIDPVKGKTAAAGGNGTQAAPWNSLQAVFQSQLGYTYPLLTTAPYVVSGKSVVGPKAGPIEPGDEVLLMSGNYGAITVGQYLAPIVNPSFVTIAAAPGQTPVLTTLGVSASKMFTFNGLKVQSTQTNGAWLIAVKDQGATLSNV